MIFIIIVLIVKVVLGIIVIIGFIRIVCRASRLESVDFIGQRKGFACQVTENNHKKNIGILDVYATLSALRLRAFRRLKHPHPRTEAAGRSAWMRLCWK